MADRLPIADTLAGKLMDSGWIWIHGRPPYDDADELLPILARFASPEAKREVLATLLRERLGAVANWDGDVRFERYGNAVLVSREEVLKALAPLEAP